MKILFVCTGNTCRSPMAEAIFNQMSKDGNTGDSAGIFASNGAAASLLTIDVMQDFGIDMTQHNSKLITSELIEKSNLVLTMECRQCDMLKKTFREFEDKIFTLLEYACGIDGDIVDPYGGDFEVYFSCAREIQSAVQRLLGKLEVPNA